MNITEFMSFDLAWFTTLPGILITGGVVVLLIALIFFIASNKKDKNKSPEVVSVDNVGTQSETNNDLGYGMPVNDFSAVPNTSMDNNVQMNNDVNGMNMMGNATDSYGVSMPNVDTQTVPSYDNNPVAATNVVDFSAPVQTVVNEVNTVESPVNGVLNIPSVEPVVAVVPETNVPEVAPVVPETNVPEVAPVVNEPIVTEPTPMPTDPVVPTTEEVAPAVEPAVPEKPMIYGGVDPINTVTTPVAEKPVIYGGANPLENTTTIPKMVNHEAYGINSAPAVEPVAPAVPEVSVPEVAPVVNEPVVAEAPTIPAEPVAPVVPEVTPVVEPVLPTAPVVETPVVSTAMPMTGEEMFGSTDTSVDSSSVSDEIETLEF